MKTEYLDNRDFAECFPICMGCAAWRALFTTWRRFLKCSGKTRRHWLSAKRDITLKKNYSVPFCIPPGVMKQPPVADGGNFEVALVKAFASDLRDAWFLTPKPFAKSYYRLRRAIRRIF